MVEKKLTYLKNTIQYKETEIPERKDNYGRPLVIRVARQSDAEHITDEKSGAKRWTAGAFMDMQINAYIKDEDYDGLTDEKLMALAKKIHL